MHNKSQRTLEARPCQHWTLYGISAMHQALVRRIVEQYNNELCAATENASELPSLVWHVYDQLPGVVEWLSPAQSGVAIAHPRQLHAVYNNHDRTDSNQFRIDPQHIRLAWAWPSTDDEYLNLDFSNATEQIAHGVIHDSRTALSWLKIARDRSTVHLEQNHFLLSDLKLPQL